MDYPYINLDLLKEYSVHFHGDIYKWANTMQYNGDSYDGEKPLLFIMNCDRDCYFLIETGDFIEMRCVSKKNSPYPVITIEELIEMSGSSVDYDFSNELQTLLDN